MGKLLEWPDRLPSRIWWPDQNFWKQKEPPRGIVVHSGDKGPGLAEAARRMDISYHFCHSTTHGCLVQMVGMRYRAYHAGSKGNHWLGIALTGPDEQLFRPDSERQDFRLLLGELQEAFNGSLLYYCRHSDIEAKKKDPGPGFTQEWIEGFGLEWKRAS